MGRHDGNRPGEGECHPEDGRTEARPASEHAAALPDRANRSSSGYRARTRTLSRPMVSASPVAFDRNRIFSVPFVWGNVYERE